MSNYQRVTLHQSVDLAARSTLGSPNAAVSQKTGQPFPDGQADSTFHVVFSTTGMMTLHTNFTNCAAHSRIDGPCV